jgi:hypothetical protein
LSTTLGPSLGAEVPKAEPKPEKAALRWLVQRRLVSKLEAGEHQHLADNGPLKRLKTVVHDGAHTIEAAEKSLVSHMHHAAADTVDGLGQGIKNVVSTIEHAVGHNTKEQQHKELLHELVEVAVDEALKVLLPVGPPSTNPEPVLESMTRVGVDRLVKDLGIEPGKHQQAVAAIEAHLNQTVQNAEKTSSMVKDELKPILILVKVALSATVVLLTMQIGYKVYKGVTLLKRPHNPPPVNTDSIHPAHLPPMTS